jgi:hypothetical protein
MGIFRVAQSKFSLFWAFEGASPYTRATACDVPGRYGVVNENMGTETVSLLPPNFVAVSLCPEIFKWPLLLKTDCECVGSSTRTP